MEEKIQISILLSLYGKLLTKTQQKYMDLYYNEDLSLSEIAENYEITRNAVHNQLREAKEKLEYYDKVLKLSIKQRKVKEICDRINDSDLKKDLKDIFDL